MERRRLDVATIVRSIGVGGLGTITDLAVLGVLATSLALGPRLASPFALAAGLTVQFVGQKLFAFRDTRQAWGTQAALFLLVEVLGFALNLGLFDLAVRFVPAPYLLLRVVVQFAVYTCVCLPLWARIFDGRAPEVRA